MSIAAIVHVKNEEAIVCELNELPETNSQVIILNNPRRRDGKDLHYLDADVTTMILPWGRINFVQIMPSHDTEDIIGFVRE